MKANKYNTKITKKQIKQQTKSNQKQHNKTKKKPTRTYIIFTYSRWL